MSMCERVNMRSIKKCVYTRRAFRCKYVAMLVGMCVRRSLTLAGYNTRLPATTGVIRAEHLSRASSFLLFFLFFSFSCPIHMLLSATPGLFLLLLLCCSEQQSRNPSLVTATNKFLSESRPKIGARSRRFHHAPSKISVNTLPCIILWLVYP